MLLKLKRVEEKSGGRDRDGCSLKRMFVVGLTANGGESHSPSLRLCLYFLPSRRMCDVGND